MTTSRIITLTVMKTCLRYTCSWHLFARKVQRFLSQPFFVAEQFTGLKGVLVPIEDTIRGFNAIMDGEVDEYPEAAFNLVGTLEDAIEKGKKLMAAAKA